MGHCVDSANALRHPWRIHALSEKCDNIGGSVQIVHAGTVELAFESAAGGGVDYRIILGARVRFKIGGAYDDKPIGRVFHPIAFGHVHQWFPGLVCEYGAFARIESFGQIQIGFAPVLPSVFVGNPHMPPFNIGVTQLDIMLERLPHVQLDVELCRVGVDIVTGLHEIIPTAGGIEIVVVCGDQIIILRRLGERYRQSYRQTVLGHSAVGKFDAIQTVEIRFLSLPTPFDYIPVAHVPRDIAQFKSCVWRPFRVRKIDR